MMKKRMGLLFVAALLAISCGCAAQNNPPVSPSPSPSAAVVVPSPSPAGDASGDKELWKDTVVFGYLQGIDGDRMTVRVKGEETVFMIADREKLEKEINVLKIETGGYIAVNFTTSEDGVKNATSVERAIPPEE